MKKKSSLKSYVRHLYLSLFPMSKTKKKSYHFLIQLYLLLTSYLHRLLIVRAVLATSIALVSLSKQSLTFLSFWFLILFLIFQLQFTFIFFCIGFRCTEQWPITYLTKCFPWYFQYPPGTVHSYYRLLTTFPTLYFTSPWLFWNYQSVLLSPITFYTHSPTCLTSGVHRSALCVYESTSILVFHLFCFLNST